MKLILASSLGLLLSVSASAQRGSAAGHASASFSSGRSFAAPTSPSFGGTRSSFSSASGYRPNFTTQQHGPQYSSPIGPPPFGGTQPTPGRRNPYRYPGNGYKPYYYSRSVYAVPGWIGGGFYDYGYPADSGDQQAAPTAGYAEPAPADNGGDQAYVPMPPRSEYRPDYQPNAPAPADLPEQPQVALVFKDGRPQQMVQNYAITRNILYVLDGGRRREIPLEQLDLLSTEKTNRDAGVDFAIPAS